SLDEVVLKQHFQLVEETESPRRCNVFRKLVDIADRSMLATQYRRIEINHTCEPVSVERHGNHLDFPIGFCMVYIMRYFVIVAIGILIYIACFFNCFHERRRATVYYRDLGAIDIDEHIIDLQAYQCSHEVFYSTHPGTILGYRCAAGGV